VLQDARAVYTPGISERAGSTSEFYHGDALGSTRGITNSSQTVTDAVLYDAFGMTVSRTGTTATPFGFVGAQGYQSDADSGLQLLGHRYYDPSIGRFLSSDPIQDGDNWYAYCGDNPLKWLDPQGTNAKSDEEFEKHVRDIREAFKRVKDLWDRLDRIKGPKKRGPIEDEIAREEKLIRSHEKEVDQKWPGRYRRGRSNEGALPDETYILVPAIAIPIAAPAIGRIIVVGIGKLIQGPAPGLARSGLPAH
jgi:RHS repeat-associated protein